VFLRLTAAILIYSFNSELQTCIHLIAMERKLLHNSEDKISFLQIIGFLVILLGLIDLVITQIFSKLSGEVIAIDFFAIMLGFAFAFPDLLRDSNKGLSTMRIVVFMMVNVICILLLKIGWDAKSLGAIGLDQYWMGVIAFIFGAKATQTYFESKLAGGTGSTGGTGVQPNAPEPDGCGVTPAKLTANNELPAAKGGVL
jgi:hypothetical protein